jgi:plasmid stabilization system protein ParE
MVQYKPIIAAPAEDDLAAVYHYIAEDLDSPDTALRILETVYTALRSLANMPHRCPLVDDERLAAIGYRMLPIKNYLAFFTVNEETKTVCVERILYARRDWLHIL